MTLKINHNVAAINSWRNLQKTDQAMQKTLEKLSSGSKLNRASDGPAQMVIAEQMRGQVASMEQAIENSETAVSMVQTTESGLNEVSNILIRMRQLSLHAANEGANDDKMLAADQAEIDNLLSTLDGISQQSQFGTRKLLDGSNGINGVAVGEGVSYISAAAETLSSPADGYEIDITQGATKARLEGSRALTQEEMNAGNIDITLHEGGRSFSYSTGVGETPQAMQRNLQQMVTQNNLKLEVGLTEDNRLFVEHTEYGSEPTFGAVVSVEGLLTDEAHSLEEAVQGLDVHGTIGGELAHGDGENLTAAKGTKADGLTIQYTGGVKGSVKFDDNGEPVLNENGEQVMEDVMEGAVYVTNNALSFQVGPQQDQTARIALPNINTHQLSRGIDNDSGYQSLGEVDVTTFQGAQDTLLMVDQAVDQITTSRGMLGAFQKNTLETNLSNLRYASENLMAAEGVLRDTDMAKEMSEFTKQQILIASGTAMLGQANQTPKSVLSLLNAQ